MSKYFLKAMIVGVVVMWAQTAMLADFSVISGNGYALENGDVNGDWARDVSDPIYLFSHLFLGGPTPEPLAYCGAEQPTVVNGDSNGDESLDISDGAHLLKWLYADGSAPVEACTYGDGFGAARNSNPRVIPPQARAHGMSYGDWGLAWWKWALELPRENHPVWDETGADCGEGQTGSVWFLAGTFGGTVVRDQCTVPAGKAIFFPLLNWSAWTPEDLDWANSLGVPGDTDVEILQNLVHELVNQTFDLQCSVDGVELKNLDRYRGASSGATSVDLSDVLEEAGYPPGFRELLVSEGHWLMLAPLPPGEHTIVFSSKMDCAGGDECFGEVFSFDVGPIVYEFTVE